MLGHELAGLEANPLLQGLALGRFQHADHDRLAIGAEAGAHDHGVEVGQDEGCGRGLAQPPHVERRQTEWLVEQAFAQAFEEGHQGRGLDDARAQGVRQHDATVARRLDQTGDAERRIGTQFQRIGEGAVEAAQQHVDRPQPGQGF